jgi:phosphoribosylanthranilate isomerase
MRVRSKLLLFPKLYLAGGLNDANVEEAIGSCNPYAVDVGSGVESTRGKKDAQALCRFMQKAKAF